MAWIKFYTIPVPEHIKNIHDIILIQNANNIREILENGV